MTLIVALQGTDGLVLAADSRGTIGDPRGLTAINDSQQKLVQLGRYCGIGISGSSELAAQVIDMLRAQLNDGQERTTDEIVQKTRSLLRACYDDWFAKFDVKERPAIGFTAAGLQTAGDQLIPRTYLLASHLDFAPQLFPNGNSLLGVPQYAVYLMHRLYHPQMTVDDLARLAVYLISETATQDPKVGGPIRVASITRERGYEALSEAAVTAIADVNSQQNDRLRQFFFAGGPHG